MVLKWLNRGIYEQLPAETRIRNELDYKYDLYRNIEKLKYQDKYITRKQFLDEYREKDKREKEYKRQLYEKYGLVFK